MSIVNTFDNISKEIIDPYQAIDKVDGFPKTLIAVFTQKFADLLLNTVKAEQISEISGGRKIPIYKFNYGGKEIGVAQGTG